jgi:cation:H+ antiporter
MTFLMFVAGLLLLIAGSEALVRGASGLAAGAGISPLIIGLTVVAFGTSSPELAISIKSALSGRPDIALGNVVGSNIFNVLVILGASALISPLVVSRQLVRLDVPLMVGASVLVLVFSAGGKIGRVEGLLLFCGLLAYILILIRLGRRESREVVEEYVKEFGPGGASVFRHPLVNIGLAAGSLGVLVLGSRWLVASAVVLAKTLGVSDLVIGLTIIAAGTSLPELVTSIIATVRGERDIAVGNAVGSSLFNLLGVLGLTAILAPSGIEVSAEALRFDLPVMTAVAVACLPIFFTGNRISRWEGALFLGYYAAYTLYLVLAATQNQALPLFRAGMLFFVVPLTFLTLIVVTVRTIRSRKKAGKK